MIKVCHIVNHITGKADGVYTHLKMIFRYTDKNKIQHFLIFQGGEKVEREISEMGIKVYVCKSLKKKISLKAFLEIYRFIKENNINVIHTHLIKPYAIAGLLNIFLRRKFIFNYHGLFIYRNVYYNIFEKTLYGFIHFLINIFKAADVVLVPSEESKRSVLSETKLFRKLVVYYNSYDIENNGSVLKEDLVKKINLIKKTDLIIAVVARLERQKRIDNALELFKDVNEERKNTSLLIFGDGDIKENLQRLAAQLGIDSRVYFFDFVQNISSYFHLFDILLFTSDWEGMPLTLWEAMGNKLPVIAPDVGGFKEVIEENSCGLIFSPGDMQEAREKLLELIDKAALRNELGENGLNALSAKYTPEKFKCTIDKVYFDLVS